MAEEPSRKSNPTGAGFWMVTIFGAGLVLYLLGFAVLVLVPQTSNALRILGVPSAALDTIYYPIVRLLE